MNVAMVERTMSSRDIANLTGKNHADVCRDIRKVLEEAELGESKYALSYLSKQNKEVTEYKLPRMECDLVISGYSVKYRMTIIQRWHELENQAETTPSLPTTVQAIEQMLALAKKVEAIESERDLAIATKAEIGNRREATAMSTASTATRKATKLEQELDKSKEYASVKRMELVHHGMKFNWRLLKTASQDVEQPPLDVFDQNYGTVKAWHTTAWKEAYALEVTP